MGEIANLPGLANILGWILTHDLPRPTFGFYFQGSSNWDPILEKVGRRLAGMEKLYLSKGGRVALIKSTLSSILTYYMSLFRMPTNVTNKLEKLQWDLLWGDVGDVQKIHLVDWRVICPPLKRAVWVSEKLARLTKLS